MTTIRVRFTKRGEAAYISLLDLQRVMGRSLKRSGLPVYYTQGFNPHIYMTFAVPLSLGQESDCETMDFKTELEELHWQRSVQALNACLPKGIVVTEMYKAETDADEIAFASYSIRFKDADAAKAAADAYNAAAQAVVIKEGKRGKTKEVNLKEYLPSFTLRQAERQAVSQWVLPAGNAFNVNPMLLIHYLEEHCSLPELSTEIIRTDVLTKSMEKFK